MTTFKSLLIRLATALEAIATNVKENTQAIYKLDSTLTLAADNAAAHHQNFANFLKFIQETFPGFVNAYNKNSEGLINGYNGIAAGLNNCAAMNKENYGRQTNAYTGVINMLKMFMQSAMAQEPQPTPVDTSAPNVSTTIENTPKTTTVENPIKEEQPVVKKTGKRGRPKGSGKKTTTISAADTKKAAMEAKVGLEAFSGYSTKVPAGRKSYIELTDGITGSKAYYNNLTELQKANKLSQADYQRIAYAVKHGKAVNGVFIDKVTI